MPPLLSILGGGQLARMMARAAEPLGVRCRVLDPSESPSAARFAEHVRADYTDREALARLAEGADAVTYEWENVPAESAAWLAERLPVHPNPGALRTAQDRQHERDLFRDVGIPLPETTPIDSLEGLVETLNSGFPVPCLLKARRMGYDGKGQFLLTDPLDAPKAWESIGRVPAVLDAFVDFTRELSILAVRAADGTTACYPLTQNTHRGGILRLSLAPAPNVSGRLQQLAERHITAILDRLDYVGVLALELFEVGSGEEAYLVANEIAPRVHNSGHWTIEGAQTSQFENHVRAVLGLPLGPTGMADTAQGGAAMINAIGSLPKPDAVGATPGAALHDYEKAPRPNRKVGHTTIVAATEADLRARLERFTRIVG